MANSDEKIIVCSKSFSKNITLREEMSKAFPNTHFNDNYLDFNSDELIEFIGSAAGVVVGLEPINDLVFRKCSNLKIVSKYGVGLDNVDLVAAQEHKVKIGWTGGVNRRSVSEMVLCFMIGLSRHVLFSSRRLVINNDWTKNGGFNLSTRVIGIIGVGFIGKDVIELLKPFGCKILVNDIRDQSEYYYANGLIESTKEDIFEQADIISIHTPLDGSTDGLFNEKVFGQMKKSGYLINCARGGLVVQEDLKRALIQGDIAGAAIDVFDTEPCEDLEFLRLSNLIPTPHTGGSSEEAILAMGRSAIDHLVKFFSK